MDLEHKAIERLQYAAEISAQYYNAPLIVTYSGGKDSEVNLELARRAEIDFEVQHHLTTVDAPETIYHVRQRFYELECDGIKCDITKPIYKGHPISMWTLIPQKQMPPTRLARYCCLVFKEYGGKNRCISTGVRWDEGQKRKVNRGILEAGREHIFQQDNDEAREAFETCSLKGETTINPIVDWPTQAVWDYIRSEKLSINPLYACGFCRIGCIGCPMSGRKGMLFEFLRYPRYKNLYIRAFGRMLDVRKAAGKDQDTANGWINANAVFSWWTEDPEFYGQIELEGVKPERS